MKPSIHPPNGDEQKKQKGTFKTITIRWECDSTMPTIRGKWKRLPGGCIEATYTPEEELAQCLEVFEAISDPE